MLVVVVTEQVQVSVQSCGNTFDTSFTHYHTASILIRPAFGPTIMTVLLRGLLYHDNLNPTIQSVLWGNSLGCTQVSNFPPS